MGSAGGRARCPRANRALCLGRGVARRSAERCAIWVLYIAKNSFFRVGFLPECAWEEVSEYSLEIRPIFGWFRPRNA
eukprot:5962665-Prymnesium_polylepis.1